MFAVTHQRIQHFSTFIETERSFYDTQSGNYFAFALGTLLRKYRKIWLLRERAMPIAARYSELLASMLAYESDVVSDEQQRRVEEISDVTVDIELHFESFFMYGAILCDEVAQLLLYLYGSARGVKLGGHRELSKNFGAYAEALSLQYDPELLNLATFLETELCDYRDKQIVHDFHPRKLDAVSCDRDSRDVRMSYGMLYPKDNDAYVTSKTWGELMEALDRYIQLTLNLVRANREKSRFGARQR